MKLNYKNLFLNGLGGFFILVGLIAIINANYEYDFLSILWFCYLGLILIGVGVLFRNSFLIASQLNILTIPLIIWSLDFIYFIFTKNYLFGITDYFFEAGPLISKIVTVQHLYTIPLAFIALYLIKLKRKNAWKLSIFQVVAFYAGIYFFTPVERNINCVFKFCGDFQVPMLYSVFWFVIFFTMIFFTNFALNKLFYKK
ncbi:MAG: hypothetical protein U9Q06_02815 [Nanoarchaeota archaeon]|nr:hypothetical protein [Nanoarchaeota archaeon]